MKTDVFIFQPRLGDAAGVAAWAEEQGFDGLFVAETSANPFLPLAAAMGATSRIDLGTAIALAFVRSPMVTAVAAWDLQRATGGRFQLGLGAQIKAHNERRYSVPYGDKPAARLGEQVLAIRHIWDAFSGEHGLDFHGDFYDFSLLPEAANPGPIDCAPPPIMLAAVGPVMFRTAATVADGALVHPMNTPAYLRDVAEPAIAQGLAASGRDRDDFTLSATVFACVGRGEEGERHRAAVRRQLAFYGSTPAYRRVFEHHGWGDLQGELHALMAQQDFEAMERALRDEVLDAFSVRADDWPTAAQLARERYAGLVDRINLNLMPVGNARTAGVGAAGLEPATFRL